MKRANIIQKFRPVNPTEKKWDDIKADWVRLYVEGWNDDYILASLEKKYYMKQSTLKVRLKLRELKTEAIRQIAALKKAGKYRLPEYENTSSPQVKLAEFSVR